MSLALAVNEGATLQPVTEAQVEEEMAKALKAFKYKLEDDEKFTALKSAMKEQGLLKPELVQMLLEDKDKE